MRDALPGVKAQLPTRLTRVERKRPWNAIAKAAVKGRRWARVQWAMLCSRRRLWSQMRMRAQMQRLMQCRRVFRRGDALSGEKG